MDKIGAVCTIGRDTADASKMEVSMLLSTFSMYYEGVDGYG